MKSDLSDTSRGPVKPEPRYPVTEAGLKLARQSLNKPVTIDQILAIEDEARAGVRPNETRIEGDGMSSTRIQTCDGCGKTETLDESRKDDILKGLPVVPWWHAGFTSSDFNGTRGTSRGFRMRFVSWDFCDDCCAKGIAAVTAAVGPPHHDDREDEPPEGTTP